MPVNIFVADDQNLVRQGIKLVLEHQCDVNVVGEAADGFACLNEVNKLNPNIVILDVEMANFDGIKTLQIMKEHNFQVKTLMLADNDNDDNLLKAVELGCDGYILKNCNVDTFKKAIYSIYNGDKFIQEELKEKLQNSMTIRNSSLDRLNELSKREIDVLKLLAEGLFNKEIAVKLKISERTVKNHVSSIFKKIQVNDRTQAAVFAIKNNLISI